MIRREEDDAFEALFPQQAPEGLLDVDLGVIHRDESVADARPVEEEKAST
jgi:hypothetical protein